jgi:hypothetical protein
MSKPPLDPFSESLNVVFVGSFNPAIFQPEWFVRQKLISAETTWKVVVVSPDVTEAFLGHIKIFATRDRIICSVTNVAHAEALQDIVLGILQLLPHVPVIACGLNHEATFRVETEQYWNKIGDVLAPKGLIWTKLCKRPGMLRLTINSPKNGQYQLHENLTIEPVLQSQPKQWSILIKANTHLDVARVIKATGKEGPTSVEIALDFLKSDWKRATVRAKEVAEIVFESIPE